MINFLTFSCFTKKHIISACVLLALHLFSCSSNHPESAYTELQGEAQGTTFSIKYNDNLNRDFSGAVDSIFRLIDHSMSAWDTGSIVSAVNANRPIEVDEHFKRVFFAASDVHKNTAGMFDLTVGPLVQRWGFSFKKNETPPDSNEVQNLLRLVGMEKVSIKNNRLIKVNSAIAIDFNAIAQGYTVDLLGNLLQKNGVQNYMVEVGGEVLAKGVNSRRAMWNIGIDKPLEGVAEGRPLQCVVPLQNKALATSGSYRKFRTINGRKYSHAINPKTGQPVQHNLLSVSVLAPSCMGADAYATAFLVLGLEDTKRLAKELGLEVYCIYEKEDNSIGVWKSAGFEIL